MISRSKYSGTDEGFFFNSSLYTPKQVLYYTSRGRFENYFQEIIYRQQEAKIKKKGAAVL